MEIMIAKLININKFAHKKINKNVEASNKKILINICSIATWNLQ